MTVTSGINQIDPYASPTLGQQDRFSQDTTSALAVRWRSRASYPIRAPEVEIPGSSLSDFRRFDKEASGRSAPSSTFIPWDRTSGRRKPEK